MQDPSLTLTRPADPRRLIALLLGREPHIDFSIVLECPWGWPAVIFSEPFGFEGEPNPNLYYLVCPYLRREIARLEDTGLIRRLEKRLQDEPELAADLIKAQEAHMAIWKAAAVMANPDSGAPAIPHPRIASSADDLLLKCLHAHLAWYLVHPDYLLGGIIAIELGDIWCDDETCRRMARKEQAR